MLILFTLVVMAVVAASQYRNGPFTSVTVLLQVMLAGLVAFAFWEPVADELDGALQGGRAAGLEDAIALTFLFVAAFLGMRVVTNRINHQLIDYPTAVQHAGGPAVGLITGYLLSGFLVCVFQTLPIEEHFLGFAPRRADESSLRRIVPADRVWLAMMRHAGAYPLSWREADENAPTAFDRYATFDRQGTFELRYGRYRRGSEGRGPRTYRGEFDAELGRKK